MGIPMQYGVVTGDGKLAQGMKFITSDTLVGNTDTKVLTFEAGGYYLLFTAEWTTSSGAYRGHRIISIKAPEEAVFGSAQIARGNAYASTNSGVTLTNNADSTLSIKSSSANYSVRYSLYKVG